MVTITEGEIAFRLFLACIFGGIVGLERERHDSPAGFRTHILVSLGSALIMILSMYGFREFISDNKDPARLAAQVVSGIGFLGAGTILRDKTTVRGLTTAASLWVVSAIGLATGAGFYLSAFFVTFLVFITLERFLESFLFRGRRTLKVMTVNGTEKMEDINRIIQKSGLAKRNILVKIGKEGGSTILEYRLRMPFRKPDLRQIREEIEGLEGVSSTEQG